MDSKDPLIEHEKELVDKVERKAALLQALRFSISALANEVDQVDAEGNLVRQGMFSRSVLIVLFEEFNRIQKTEVTSKSEDVHIDT